ncbi:MAG: hypothetical protein ACYCV4_03940 [Dermatophilaceae bacterium]
MSKGGERPTVVLVMFEWSVEYPLWDRSPGGFGPVDAETLGVSPELAGQLREWSAEHDDAPNGPEHFEWRSYEAYLDWRRRGLHLAYALQDNLGSEIEVRYFEDGDERPVRDRMGP